MSLSEEQLFTQSVSRVRQLLLEEANLFASYNPSDNPYTNMTDVVYKELLRDNDSISVRMERIEKALDVPLTD